MQKWASLWENWTSGFPTRSDTDRAVQSQKKISGLKFWIQKEEEMYYPSRENKGADQLRGYREADLRLCFRICKNPVFSRRGSNLLFANGKTELQISIFDSATPNSTITQLPQKEISSTFQSKLVENPQDRFSCEGALITWTLNYILYIGCVSIAGMFLIESGKEKFR